MVHLVFVFTPVANLVTDEFSCQSDEFKSQTDQFNSQSDEFICQRDEVNCQKDEFNCQNLYHHYVFSNDVVVTCVCNNNIIGLFFD